jgi:hypothetical protein
MAQMPRALVAIVGSGSTCPLPPRKFIGRPPRVSATLIVLNLSGHTSTHGDA